MMLEHQNFHKTLSLIAFPQVSRTNQSCLAPVVTTSLGVFGLATRRTFPHALVLPPVINQRLQLCPQVRAVKHLLPDDRRGLVAALLAVPPQPVQAPLGPHPLHDEADGVGEPHRVVRGVARQQEHLALLDLDVLEELPALGVLLHHLEAHGALELVEPLLRLVDVVVVARVGPADDHEDHVLAAEEAVVVDWGLQEVLVLAQP
ncbi:hypothetical protein FJTKL_06178 [Diaporthe vaccinii]|uniref:Uncharacterized protein n=1 Tax=Diaporthe vaccinii TaxID=105482 RepID=A0ABR4EXM1_9PEZI